MLTIENLALALSSLEALAAMLVLAPPPFPESFTAPILHNIPSTPQSSELEGNQSPRQALDLHIIDDEVSKDVVALPSS